MGQTDDFIELKEEIADRIKAWIKNGLPNKEKKENILKSIPGKGQMDLESPILNDEIVVDLHPKSLARDEYFRDYQNLTGSALSAASSVLNSIINDEEVALDRNVILKNLSATVKLLLAINLLNEGDYMCRLD